MNENSEHLSKIKDKLAKMMAKEESARELGNQAEAEAFASKIQELLLQYELSLDDIKAKTAESVKIDGEIFDTDTITNPHESNWVVHLYGACSRSNFCKIIIMGNSATTRIRIVGTDMNREFLHFMCHQLVPKIRSLAKKAWSEYEGVEKRNTYIRGFLKGCCQGISLKLNLAHFKNQKEIPQVNALIIQKDRAIDQWIEQTYGKLRGISMKSGKSRSGFSEGVEAGKNIEINKGVNSSRGMGGGTKLLN